MSYCNIKDLPDLDENKLSDLTKKIFDEAWCCSFHDEKIARQHIKETLLAWWNSEPFKK